MAAQSGDGRLGVVAALHREARLARAAAREAGCAPAVCVALCGIGPERARDTSLELVAGGARILLSVGIAGALVDTMRAGDLLLPRSVRDDAGVVREPDAEILARLRPVLEGVGPVYEGCMITVRRPVSAARHRRELAARTGAVAVDMESAAVARVAHEAGLPFAALRAVSDPVGQVLPSCVRHALDPHGRVRPLALAAGLARRPWQALTLVRLAGGVRRAERALRGALLVTLPLLAASRSGTAR